MNITILMASLILAIQVSAQEKKDSCCIAKQDLIGIWQRDFERAGKGLEQNFRFFADGRFEVHFTNDGEDARGLYALIGSYRLVKNELYLTIKAREIYEGGRIVISGSNEDASIFHHSGGSTREIKEPDPKECTDAINITVVGKRHIQLDNENYFKVSKQELKANGIDFPGQ